MGPTLPLKHEDIIQWLEAGLAQLGPQSPSLVSPFWPCHLYSFALGYLEGSAGFYAQAWGGYPLAELRQLVVTKERPPKWPYPTCSAPLPGERPYLDFPQRVLLVHDPIPGELRGRLFSLIRGPHPPDSFGDLRLSDRGVEIALAEEVAEEVAGRLTAQGLRSELHRGYSRTLVPYRVLRLSLPSPRLDALVARAFRLGRSEAREAIEEEFVAVDFRLETRVHRSIAEGSLVSLRGRGRVRIRKLEQNPRSGRLMAEVEVLER